PQSSDRRDDARVDLHVDHRADRLIGRWRLFAEALGVQGDAFDPREPDGLVIELPGAMEASQRSLPRPTIRYEAWPIDPPVQFVGRRRPSQAKAQTSERAHRVRVGLIVRAMSGGGYRALLGDAVRDLMT